VRLAAQTAEPGPLLVEASGVSAGYDGPPVLEGIAFSARAGERVALLGPNGAGKTTLFRVLLGELPPRSGGLRLEGRAASVPQTERSRLDFPVSALDVALMGTLPMLPWWRRPGRAERARARAALAEVGLADRADATFGALSGGQRQRVLIARALVQDARILLLDEPYSGLDVVSAQRLSALLETLAAEGRAVLIATHDVEQARAWERVLCLNRHQVAFGAPAEVLTRDALIETYGGALVSLPGGAAILPPEHC